MPSLVMNIRKLNIRQETDRLFWTLQDDSIAYKDKKDCFEETCRRIEYFNPIFINRDRLEKNKSALENIAICSENLENAEEIISKYKEDITSEKRMILECHVELTDSLFIKEKAIFDGFIAKRDIIQLELFNDCANMSAKRNERLFRHLKRLRAQIIDSHLVLQHLTDCRSILNLF